MIAVVISARSPSSSSSKLITDTGKLADPYVKTHPTECIRELNCLCLHLNMQQYSLVGYVLLCPVISVSRIRPNFPKPQS